MGKYLDKFKKGVKVVDKKIKKITTDTSPLDEDFPEEQEDNEQYPEDQEDPEDYDPYGLNEELGIRPSQKPESFHHFILENQYKDLERSIRGFKEVFEKESSTWKTKRKKEHCFTDEEAEDILRTAQSHLATDIKLGYVNKEAFPVLMDAIYKELAFLFESIAEYRYGRYNTFTKAGELVKVNYEKQYEMKLQNHKIFLELFTRVQANYSRSIQGQENKATHDSVKGQESLQQMHSDFDKPKRYM